MNRTLLTVAAFLICNISISQEIQQPERPKAELKSKSLEQKKSNVNNSSSNTVPGHPNLVKAKFSAKKVQPTVPSDYPKFVDTGNPQQDWNDFVAKEQAWIAENPKKFKAMTSPVGPDADRTQAVKYSK